MATSPSPDMEELARRVEAATGPDRALDFEIAKADGYRDVFGDGLVWDRGNDGYWSFDGDGERPALPYFTADLNAAMALVDDDSAYTTRRQCLGAGWAFHAVVYDRQMGKRLGATDKAVTAPLALCAAALRARARASASNPDMEK